VSSRIINEIEGLSRMGQVLALDLLVSFKLERQLKLLKSLNDCITYVGAMSTGTSRAHRRIRKRILSITVVGISLIGRRGIFDVLSASWRRNAQVDHELEEE